MARDSRITALYNSGSGTQLHDTNRPMTMLPRHHIAILPKVVNLLFIIYYTEKPGQVLQFRDKSLTGHFRGTQESFLRGR